MSGPANQLSVRKMSGVYQVKIRTVRAVSPSLAAAWCWPCRAGVVEHLQTDVVLKVQAPSGRSEA